MTNLQVVTRELSTILPAAVSDQVTCEAAQRVLQLRQCVMDKVMTIEEQKARMSRHEAQVEGMELKLYEDMLPYQRKDVMARIQLEKVKHEWCRQTIIQCELELGVYRKMLIGKK